VTDTPKSRTDSTVGTGRTDPLMLRFVSQIARAMLSKQRYFVD